MQPFLSLNAPCETDSWHIALQAKEVSQLFTTGWISELFDIDTIVYNSDLIWIYILPTHKEILDPIGYSDNVCIEDQQEPV